MTSSVPPRRPPATAVDRLFLTKLRAAARRSAPRSEAGSIEEIIEEAFRRTWPHLRRACITGRSLTDTTRAELRSAARQLTDLGLSRSGLTELTRGMVMVAERQVATMEHSLDAARALRFSKNAMLVVHEVTVALLEPGADGSGSAGTVANLDEVSWLEREILRRLAHGQSSNEIAGELHYSKQAVSYHLGRLLSKYRVPNRTALVAAAYENGLLPIRVGSGLRAS